MNMVFAEDDKVIRNGYIKYLSSYFENIYEANNGEEALEFVEKKDIDFILVDINMDKMDGLTLINKIRETNIDIQIAILSAYDNKDYLFKAIPMNLVSYMIKPVKREDFIKTINSVILKKSTLSNIYLINDYTWDSNLKRLLFENKVIKLTKNESILFENLCNKEHIRFSLEDAFAVIYPNDTYNENKIRMIIKRLRQKTFHEIISNDYALGYKFSYK